MPLDVPIFIPTRDLVGSLRELVDWLEKAGHQEIYLIDNDSSYAPLLEYLEQSPHTVIHAGQNIGNEAPWKAGVLEKYAKDRHFVVSDPDIVPLPECPLDTLDYFRWTLDTYKECPKVGFSVKLDDIPDHYPHKDEVLTLHPRHQTDAKRVRSVYFNAALDGVLSLHRPNSPKWPTAAWRTDFPRMAKHTAWYWDPGNMTDEEAYYKDHCDPTLGTWVLDELPEQVHVRVRGAGGIRRA